MTSPELQWAIERINADRGKSGVVADRYDVHAARASLPPSDLPMPEGLRTAYVVVDGVTCYWVCAPDADPAARILYLHGGGYFAGNFGSHRSLVGWLSKHAEAAVLFPEYRLAPEHRFPAGVDDCWAAYRFMLANGPDGQTSAARATFVAGDSAGGGLAVSTMLKARAADMPLPNAGVLICAMLDLDERTSKFLQTTQRTRDMVRQYVRFLDDLRNPLASQMLADLRGLPPLLLQTGMDDYCKDDSIRFELKAKEAGVNATLEMWPEMIHVWHRFAPKLPEANEALQAVAAFLRRHA